MVLVKASLNNDVRRFEFNEKRSVGQATIFQAVAERFRLGPGVSFRLTYEDPEGDIITVTSEAGIRISIVRFFLLYYLRFFSLLAEFMEAVRIAAEVDAKSLRLVVALGKILAESFLYFINA